MPKCEKDVSEVCVKPRCVRYTSRLINSLSQIISDREVLRVSAFSVRYDIFLAIIKLTIMQVEG